MTSRNGHKTMKTPQKLAMFDLFYDNFSGSIPPSNSFLNDFFFLPLARSVRNFAISPCRWREVFATLQSVPAVGER